MNSRTDETDTAQTYTLRCVDCPFEATVEGDVFDVFDVCDTHQEAHADHASEHFVEFELEGGS